MANDENLDSFYEMAQERRVDEHSDELREKLRILIQEFAEYCWPGAYVNGWVIVADVITPELERNNRSWPMTMGDDTTSAALKVGLMTLGLKNYV